MEEPTPAQVDAAAELTRAAHALKTAETNWTHSLEFTEKMILAAKEAGIPASDIAVLAIVDGMGGLAATAVAEMIKRAWAHSTELDGRPALGGNDERKNREDSRVRRQNAGLRRPPRPVQVSARRGRSLLCL